MKTANRLLAIILLFACCGSAGERKAKSVILFLGDAAGTPTLHAASVQEYGDSNRLFLYRMPNIALSDTSSASDWVTDSAAGMTAIVTGEKTNNGVVSQSASAVRGKKDGEPLKTLLEYAEERGLSTGVVSNSPITDATPAACYAHVNDRKMTGEIFGQALNPRFGDGVDVMIGPGRQAILTATRELGMNLETEIPAKGFRFGETLDQVPPDARRAIVLLGPGEVDLGAATELAIRILSKNPKGFFLMVESDLHTDNLSRGLNRAVAFDRIIESTAASASKDTLILFTADHSFDIRVGGATRKGLPLVTQNADGKPVPAKSVMINGHHSAEQVLVAAQGPGASRVRGVIANTDIFHIILSAYRWKPEPAQTPPQITSGN